jgi:HEAT repeat protein
MHTTIFHRLGLLALVSLALCNSPASAAPRKWKDVTGKHTTEAEFVELDGNTLRLKRSDGKEITIQLDRLGVEERMFAIRESRLRAATPPELSAKGKELSSQLVSEVKAAADPYSLKKKLTHRDIEEGLAPALQALLKRGEELVTLESRRAAVAPALTVLLKDPSPAVRLVAVRAVGELGDAAVSAAPGLVACLDDQNELVKELALSAISNLGHRTDATVPALVSGLEKGPLGSAKVAGRLIATSIQTPDGPHLESAAPRLVAIVVDPKQEKERRIAAAFALSGVLRFHQQNGRFYDTGRYYDDEAVQAQIEKQAAARAKQLKETTEPLAAALEKSDDPQLTAILFSVVALHSPELLKKLPNETLVGMIEKLEDVEFDDDELRFNSESPFDVLQAAMARGTLSIQLTPTQCLKLLSSEKDRLRQFGQAQLLRNPEQTRKILPEISKVLLNSKDSEVRVAALGVMQAVSLRSSGDLSSSPVVAIRVKADKGQPVYEIGGKSVPSVERLVAAIESFKPAAAVEAEFDIEKTLKEMSSDEDDQVRYLALQALAGRQTETAKKILQDLSRTALKEEVREAARHMIREEREFGPGREDGEDSPFEPGKKKEKRNVVGELTLDPSLRMEQAVGLLQSVMDSDVRGLRVSTASKDARKGATFDLIAADHRRQMQPYFQLKLGERVGAGRAPLEIKDLRREEAWFQVPNVEALRFLTEWQIGNDGGGREYLDDFGRGRRNAVGDGALPYLATITAAPGATLGDCLETLEHLGLSSQGVRRENLIQWIRLTVGDRTTPVWYMKVNGLAAAERAAERAKP